MSEVKIIEGGQFNDERGKISYANGFSFEDVNRFYVITHNDTETIRAWQGHRLEKKFFFVVKGSFIIAWVKIDEWDNPSKDLKAEHLVMTEKDSPVLCLPAGYANGLRALEKDSKVLVFSEFDLDKSVEEKIRFDSELWFDWNELKSINS